MKTRSSVASKILLSLLLPGMIPAELSAAKWDPINPAELAETAGQIDPEAGAEVLLRDIVVDHQNFYHPTIEHFERVRIFNERGIENLSKIDIRHERSTGVSNMAARVIHPDGTVVELGRDEFHSRDLIKTGKERVRAKSFAPPGLKPGVIIEYRYTLNPAPGDLFAALYLQGDFPVRRAHCKIRGLSLPGWSMKALFFNSPEQKITMNRHGFNEFTLTNLQAYREEPFPPPKIHTQASVMFYYFETAEADPEKYWPRRALKLQRTEDRMLKSSAAVTAAAASIGSPDDAPENRLRAYYDYCRTQIANRSRDAAKYTSEERKKLPKNNSPSDTLKNRSGEPDDINLLFGALARTTGLETKLANVNDRSLMLISPEFAEPFTVNHLVVAIRMDDDWVFCDPGATYMPFGMLSWKHTDTYYLLADKKGGELKLLPGPPGNESVRRRRTDLVLNAAGTVEGRVRESYSGLWEADLREDLADRTPEERVLLIRDSIDDDLPRATVSDIAIENADDLLKPLRVSYRISVPDYCEMTGSRMFIQPAVFQKASSPLFEHPTREQQVIFQYRSREEDTVVISLPDGYSVEGSTAPASQDLGLLGRYEVALGMLSGANALAYKRAFQIDTVAIAQPAYDSCRVIFEALHSRDNHLVTLKREDARAAAGRQAAPEAAGGD